MALKDEVESLLRSDPSFRERKNKDRGLAYLLDERYHALSQVSRETLIAVLQDYASLDRYWRMILKSHQELRGKDYDDKEDLEISKIEELGYNIPRTTAMGSKREAISIEKQLTFL